MRFSSLFLGVWRFAISHNMQTMYTLEDLDQTWTKSLGKWNSFQRSCSLIMSYSTLFNIIQHLQQDFDLWELDRSWSITPTSSHGSSLAVHSIDGSSAYRPIVFRRRHRQDAENDGSVWIIESLESSTWV
jgi:hypothetical protein